MFSVEEEGSLACPRLIASSLGANKNKRASSSSLSCATRTTQRLVGAKTFEDVVEIQSAYAKKAYDEHVAEVSKLGKMCAALLENAYKQTTERA